MGTLPSKTDRQKAALERLRAPKKKRRSSKLAVQEKPQRSSIKACADVKFSISQEMTCLRHEHASTEHLGSTHQRLSSIIRDTSTLSILRKNLPEVEVLRDAGSQELGEEIRQMTEDHAVSCCIRFGALKAR